MPAAAPPLPVDSARGRAAAARRRARARRRDGVVVVRRSTATATRCSTPPCTSSSAAWRTSCSAGSRTSRRCGSPSASSTMTPAAPRARVLRRLGLGVGRGRASRWCCSTGARHGRPERRRLLTVRGGYHGDTFGAMAVCDPDGGMHRAVHRRRWPSTSSPTARRTASARRSTPRGRSTSRRSSSATPHELAGVIVEPVVQGAGGMRFHAPACVRLLRELCDRHGLLLVARRDRHRLRPHGRAVRVRARRRRSPTSCASARR